jgi:hypothetical protein
VVDHRKNKARFHAPTVGELALFAFGSALGFLVAWLATTGRVAYVFVMLLLAGALVYAVIDLVGYELVKKGRPR